MLNLSNISLRTFSFNSLNDTRLFSRIIYMTFKIYGLPSRVATTHGGSDASVASNSGYKTNLFRRSLIKLCGSFAGFNVLSDSIRLSSPVYQKDGDFYTLNVQLKIVGTHNQLDGLDGAFAPDNNSLLKLMGEKVELTKVDSIPVFIQYTGYTLGNFEAQPRSANSKLTTISTASANANTNTVRSYSSSTSVASGNSSTSTAAKENFSVFSFLFLIAVFALFAFVFVWFFALDSYIYGLITPLLSWCSTIIYKVLSSLLTTIIVITVPVLLTVAFFTLAERTIMASMQRRVGPNTTGIFGILQAFADGLKLAVKEPILPELSASGAFSAAPMISFVLSQISFCGLFLSDAAFQGLVLMALSSLGVYGVMLSGWASNSKYAFLGCLRSVSLMVSYELGFGAALLSISLFLTDGSGMKSLNFGDAPTFVQYALLPLFFIFLVCILAETKRVPFDLPEAESELVAGYNVEYSALGFALFFISEYANMAVMSALASIYFLGGFSALKLMAIFFFFVWVRGTLPRYRYDQFLRLGWKSLLPLSLSLYSVYAIFDYVF